MVSELSSERRRVYMLRYTIIDAGHSGKVTAPIPLAITQLLRIDHGPA